MTTRYKPTITTYTGIAKPIGKDWWAMCDQLPIAAHGASYNDAVQGIISSIKLYRGFTNGSGLPKIASLARGNGESPFEVTVADE